MIIGYSDTRFYWDVLRGDAYRYWWNVLSIRGERRLPTSTPWQTGANEFGG
ncbi:MAG: hypothetical protein GX971_09775 [Firmicutes bacterium]|nr:hypothetical protein [Bacillota bacterium]